MADNSLLPLSGDEKLALVTALKRLIDEDRYPLSPRVRTLTAILARLQPPKPARKVLRPTTAHPGATAGTLSVLTTQPKNSRLNFFKGRKS
jgi:hypothetical protein